jgi:hypothetical protein
MKIKDKVENERDNLIRVEALLGSLALSLEYGSNDLARTPDYGEIVKMALELLHGSIGRLDSLHLSAKG